ACGVLPSGMRALRLAVPEPVRGRLQPLRERAQLVLRGKSTSLEPLARGLRRHRVAVVPQVELAREVRRAGVGASLAHRVLEAAAEALSFLGDGHPFTLGYLFL